MKRVYTGIESSGKSLALAMDLERVAARNAKWLRRTGIARPIVINMALRDSYVAQIRKTGVPIVFWKNLDEILPLVECDIFIDEILKYFDARRWADLSIDAKHWLTQGAKMGIHIYGAAQDFSQVDKSFRLLVNQCFHVTKMIGSPRPMKTAPPVRFVWGLCIQRQVNPTSFKGDSVSMETMGLPVPFFIHKHYCDIFDTNAKVVPSDLPRLKHEVRYCEHYGKGEGSCTFCKTSHS